ncbi:hypothetical protein Asppvi_009330 [Aspergillus pseudoviridinutans]|uniref:Citrate exporter 1 n=1 Tax=Aspergillus pseudoviridinutans TaxID=1517512 RepID=A0A9P3BFK5_9EURO|nr:uncharacterized protein Asppvi_009330 [Aspergillus pseudoviridinutans]GIJ90376.1 hypothetical protein Asppvi_009330 [Aspergillus pseudoviridinutans]
MAADLQSPPDRETPTDTDPRHPRETQESPQHQSLSVTQGGQEDSPYSIYDTKEKLLIVIVVSIAGCFSPLATNTYLPALTSIASDLHVNNTLINLTVTIYLIFQGLAPAFFGQWADSSGRRPAYIACFVIFITSNIGLALQKSYAALLVLRGLQSAGSSSTVALSSAVISDIVATAERGVYVGYSFTGFLLGQTLAPALGGLLTSFLGWPWIFWFLAIFSGVFFIGMLLFLPETSRKLVGNGSRPPPRWSMCLLNLRRMEPRTKFPTGNSIAIRRHIPNPFHVLRVLAEKEAGLIILTQGINFCCFLAISTSLTSLFKTIYDFNDVKIGLCFLPLGAGGVTASYTQGILTDWNYRRHAKRLGRIDPTGRWQDIHDFPIERARVEILPPLACLQCVGFIAYGWVLRYSQLVAGSLVLLFFLGYTGVATVNIMSVLLIDLYPHNPATATAATNLVRCLLGAGVTAGIDPLLHAVGYGWAFTFIGLISLLCIPPVIVVAVFGQRWRAEKNIPLEEP